MATIQSQSGQQYQLTPGTTPISLNQGYSVVPGTVPVMDTNVLTQPGTQPTLPPPVVPTSPQQFVQGVPGAPVLPPNNLQLAPVGGSVGQQEQSLSAAQRRIIQLGGQLTGQSAEQQRLEQQQGIPGLNTQVTDLTNRLNAQTQSFQNQATAISGNAGTQEALIGRTARLRREEAIAVGTTSILLNAAQGNLEGAKNEVDRLLKFEFEPIKQELENTKQFIEMNYQNLTRADKIQADKISRQIAAENRRVDQQIEERHYQTNLALTLSKDGKLTGQLFNDVIAGKKTVSQAISEQAIANGVDPLTEMQARSTIDEIDSALSNNKGLRALVGPEGVFTRSQGNIFSRGAQQKFAASVHQITNQLTLDKLIQAKGSGATFGALSEGELVLLQSSASKLNDWEVKDKNGRGTGVWAVPESAVKTELNKIREFAKVDYKRRTGQNFIDPVNDKATEVYLDQATRDAASDPYEAYLMQLPIQ